MSHDSFIKFAILRWKVNAFFKIDAWIGENTRCFSLYLLSGPLAGRQIPDFRV